MSQENAKKVQFNKGGKGSKKVENPDETEEEKMRRKE